MRIWISALTLSIALIGCGGDDGSTAAEDDSDSGKADDVDDLDPADCSLDASADRSLSLFESNDHVQMRCRNAQGQFVETACCVQEIREYEFVTGCPMQAKFNSASGANKRCVQDFADAGEIVEGELFVPTLCCELLCDPGASWDDPMEQDTCRNSAGQFHPHVCCMMNDDLRCGGAEFDAEPNALGWRHCRAQDGDFAGQFAPAACCVDTCFDIIEEGVEEVPLECILPLEEECAGATVDANGFCRTPDGFFAKGLCCFGDDSVDVGRSDDCYASELGGEDLAEAGCEG